MTGLLAGFLVGVVSSIAATALIAWRRRLQFRFSFRATLKHIVSLAVRIDEDGYHPDYLIAIDRNSGIVASIVAAHFGLLPAVSAGTRNLRRQDGSRDIVIDDVFRGSLELLGGKDVLVVICCNDTGTSLAHVVDYLKSRHQPPKEVRTAALYTSNSPSLRPNYSAIVLGRDTRLPMNKILRSLPWVTKDWRLVLPDERHA